MNRKLVTLLLMLTCSAITLFAQEKDALKLYREGNYAEAVAVCEEELASFSDNQVIPRMDSYTVMGWAQLGMKDYEGAIESSLEALKWSRYDARIIETIGEAYYYLGNHEKSLSYFQQYIAFNPTGDRIGQVYAFSGETYIRLGQFNHADIAYSTALYHEPRSAKWWARLGYAREGAEELASAKEAYQQALAINPSLVEAKKGLERLQVN